MVFCSSHYRIILIFVTYVLERVLVITPPMRDTKGRGTISTTVQCLLVMRMSSHIAKVIYFSTLANILTLISLKKLKRTLSDQRKLYSTFRLPGNAKKCKSPCWLKIGWSRQSQPFTSQCRKMFRHTFKILQQMPQDF